MTAGEGKTGEEKVSGVAATIYLEMNRCIKVGNLKAFREAITVSKQIIRSDELRGFHGKLAEHKDSQTQRNLLHTAASYAANEDDARFFSELISLRFPLYDEDSEHNFAAFYIA